MQTKPVSHEDFDESVKQDDGLEGILGEALVRSKQASDWQDEVDNILSDQSGPRIRMRRDAKRDTGMKKILKESLKTPGKLNIFALLSFSFHSKVMLGSGGILLSSCSTNTSNSLGK